MRFLKRRPPTPVSPSLAATLSGHDTAVNVVRFSPDGQLLAAGCGRTVVLWDVSVPAHPARRAVLSHPRSHPKAAAVAGVVINQALACVREVDFSPDGRSLACHCDKTVVLWDVTDLAHPAQRATLTHHGRAGLAGAMGFSPDGRLLATGAKNTVVLWDVTGLAHPAQAATVQLFRTYTGSGRPVHTVRAVAFSPDGRSLAAGSGWSVASQYSSSSEGAIALWDVTDPAHPVQTSARTFGSIASRGAGAQVSAVAFSPDGRLAAASPQPPTVWWLDNTGPGHLVTDLTGHQGQVLGVRFSPDGRLLASYGTDKTVRLWEAG
jgi:WD40 repeat protein